VLTLGHLAGCDNDLAVSKVVIDSRQAQAGSVFYAFCGERVDGHDYVLAALQRGAMAAFVEQDVPGVSAIEPAQVAALTLDDLPVAVRVASTQAALQQAAARYRTALDLDVVAVTGSVGKTTAKEAIAAVASQGHRVLKSEGNANNELGLPLTLLEAEATHQMAVLEMGMYARGEIALLCQVARPRIGVVTNVQPVHLERLGSIEAIAQAKSELVAALPTDGVAVLNGDDPRVAAMAGLFEGVSIMVGWGEANHVRLTAVEPLGLAGTRIDLAVAGLEALGVTPARRSLHCLMLGQHAAMPAALSVAVGLALGLDWEQMQQGLTQLGYGPRLIPRPGQRSVTLLDDAYNASPSAVTGALQVLADLPGRRVAVLGDMLELGAAEEQCHRDIGALCARCADLLITRGARARWIAAGAIAAGLAAAQITSCDDNADVLAALDGLAQEGDTILIKGSRGMAMEEVVAGWLRPETQA
jgi:UDP-N-acetylmuramoyl-tripeptide--D-alanyl-D-alanine ligase